MPEVVFIFLVIMIVGFFFILEVIFLFEAVFIIIIDKYGKLNDKFMEIFKKEL